MRQFVSVSVEPVRRRARAWGVRASGPSRRAALVVLALAVVAGGCGAREQHWDAAAGPAPVDHETVVFPLDAYRMSDDEAATIVLARATLIQQCLNRFGIDHPVSPDEHGLPYRGIDDRYGLVDREHAREWGYRTAQSPVVITPYEFSVPSSASAVLFEDARTPDGAIVDGGCVGAAGQRLDGAAGPLTVDASLVSDLDRDALQKSMADPRVQARIAQWRDCLDGNHDDPHAAVRDWNSRNGAHGQPTSDEIDSAVEDVECKESVGLTGVWAAVDIEHQRAVVADNLDGLTALREWQEKQLAEAGRILAGA